LAVAIKPISRSFSSISKRDVTLSEEILHDAVQAGERGLLILHERAISNSVWTVPLGCINDGSHRFLEVFAAAEKCAPRVSSSRMDGLENELDW
jgi:hypothetical protein